MSEQEANIEVKGEVCVISREGYFPVTFVKTGVKPCVRVAHGVAFKGDYDRALKALYPEALTSRA